MMGVIKMRSRSTGPCMGSFMNSTNKNNGGVFGNASTMVKHELGFNAGRNPEVGIAGIKEQMEIIASCGKKIGTLDGIEGHSVKLTARSGFEERIAQYYIPLEWIKSVDTAVHLNRNSSEVEHDWKLDETSYKDQKVAF